MDTHFWLKLAGYFSLILMSAFFAGAETALTAVSRARMHALETDGNLRAKLVNSLRESKEKLIGGLLLGNTLSHVAASALATSVMIEMLGPSGVIYATIFVSTMLLIFGEVVPKTYAMIHADRMALFIAPTISFFLKIFSPIIYSVEKSVHWTFKVFGVTHAKGMLDAHEEELRGAIQLFRETMGVEEDQEKGAMLRSILDLAEVDVKEVMIHRKSVQMVDANWPIEKIVDALLKSPFSRLPAYQTSQDNIVGIVHSKMLLRELKAAGGDVSKVNLKNAMTAPWFIPESTSLFDQLQEFRSRQEHIAVMVDEYGQFMGIITLEDIVEEIVGEIGYDRKGLAIKGVQPQKDGSFMVDGKVTIRDLNRELDWELPDEDYSTLAGLILYEAQRIPNAGQVFAFYGFRFEIVRKARNQISLIKVLPPPAEQKSDGDPPPRLRA